MSRNIKEIGKELMGKSLNSFHRKTGLTQLEENNKMQDGILDGILSQVDDAYIEKTEQSNVIHLDGSGDGVVVVDGIEGNTMVNLHPTDLKIGSGDGQDSSTTWHVGVHMDKTRIKPNTYYTVFVLNSSSKVNRCYFNLCRNNVLTLNENKSSLFYTDDYEKSIAYIHFYSTEPVPKSEVINTKIVVLEGDYTNCSINFIEGLQSSFEEQVEEDKYKIEILSRNKNLFDGVFDKTITSTHLWSKNYILVEPNTQYIGSHRGNSTKYLDRVEYYDKDKNLISFQGISNVINTPSNCKYIKFRYHIENQDLNAVSKTQIEKGNIATEYEKPKQNKIKLLINEPLRSAYNKKDKLCVKNGKLIIERWLQENIVNGTENWSKTDKNIDSNTTDYAHFYSQDAVTNHYNEQKCLSDKFIWEHSFNLKEHNWINNGGYQVCILKNKANTVNEFKTWLSNNNIKVISVLREPIYEEVLNEYGEPIILEGYENGTIYIDSTIVPTTTVRYTPKMESFKTLKEVENNNIMLTNDVNDNIIPYMMDVDLMIMEKEMALLSQINIRKMEVLDMTSMQKRTQDMLERLIKGKTLTEQECKTRVTTYLHAGKITDAQAEELMLLIDEVYA